MHPDSLLCSHPRSGGRWLRYLVAHYLAARYRLGVEVTPRSVFTVVPDHSDHPDRGYPAFAFRHSGGLPLLAVCHQPCTWELHRANSVLFLARNAYDVLVSGYVHLSRERGEYVGSMREFIRHPRLGVAGWIQYINSWAPTLLRHRDAVHLVYRDLAADPGGVLWRVLEFLGEPPDPELIDAAVQSAHALRSARGIRTGQEGNFWDHLQPEEIFDIQEAIDRGLSEMSVHLLLSMGVEIDPLPRGSE